MTLSKNDILSIADFNAARPRMEQAVIAAKQTRRVQVGEHMMFLFENHLTIQWQIQEMARVEGILTDVGLAHELLTYNALLPNADSLSATLLIEYTEAEERDRVLHALGVYTSACRSIWMAVPPHPPSLTRVSGTTSGSPAYNSFAFPSAPSSARPSAT